VHPTLALFPLTLFGMAVIFDVVGFVRPETVWHLVAYWNVALGVALGSLTAALGIIAWWRIPAATPTARIGTWHALTNLAALALFGASFVLRTLDRALRPSPSALVFAVAGLFCAAIAGSMWAIFSARLDRT